MYLLHVAVASACLFLSASVLGAPVAHSSDATNNLKAVLGEDLFNTLPPELIKLILESGLPEETVPVTQAPPPLPSPSTPLQATQEPCTKSIDIPKFSFTTKPPVTLSNHPFDSLVPTRSVVPELPSSVPTAAHTGGYGGKRRKGKGKGNAVERPKPSASKPTPTATSGGGDKEIEVAPTRSFENVGLRGAAVTGAPKKPQKAKQDLPVLVTTTVYVKA